MLCDLCQQRERVSRMLCQMCGEAIKRLIWCREEKKRHQAIIRKQQYQKRRLARIIAREREKKRQAAQQQHGTGKLSGIAMVYTDKNPKVEITLEELWKKS